MNKELLAQRKAEGIAQNSAAIKRNKEILKKRKKAKKDFTRVKAAKRKNS